MPETIFQDPSLQVIAITDFSPGLYQYAVGNYPVSYSTQSPLGSCSFSARCINRPGIGLVPFWGYTGVLGASALTIGTASPAGGGATWKYCLNTGIGVIGGVGPNNVSNSSILPYTDLLALTFVGIDTAGNCYSYGQRFFSTTGLTPFNFGQVMWSAANTTPTPCSWSFDITSQNLSAGVTMTPMMVMGSVAQQVIIGLPSAGVLITPDAVGQAVVNVIGGPSGFGPNAAFCTSNRIFVMGPGPGPNEITLNPVYIDGDTAFLYTDPPATPTSGVPAFTGPSNNFLYYTLENVSGFGAWGSVSTGELVLIRRGQGAVVVSGDAAFPSFVTKLPAVQGTGAIMQKMVECSIGAVYITETGGVFAWNGGNTSTLISKQIPDTACVRDDLEPGATPPNNLGFLGCRAWNDVLNNIVFFANNYIFDADNESWWYCEDPAIIHFGAWAASQSGTRLMYGMPVSPTAGGYRISAFDATTLATSWEWTSNPIATPPGALPSLQLIEICASNPSPTPCTITITPTSPSGSTSPLGGQNPQTLTFTIPAISSGYRASLRCGYDDTNICIAVTASNSLTTNPAPILHEIDLGFGQVRTSGVQ